MRVSSDGQLSSAILDRVARNDMALGDAAKMVRLSFDPTLRSNLSVGLPIDMRAYETGTLRIEHTKRIGPDDPYFKDAVRRMVEGAANRLRQYRSLRFLCLAAGGQAVHYDLRARGLSGKLLRWHVRTARDQTGETTGNNS